MNLAAGRCSGSPCWPRWLLPLVTTAIATVQHVEVMPTTHAVEL